MRTTSPIDLILSRLEKPKSGYKGQWLAICPAHKDKSPSLSIRETDQGAVLIHCFESGAIAMIAPNCKG